MATGWSTDISLYTSMGITLGQWKFEEHETLVKLSLYDNGHVLPKFRVTIYASLKFRISIFGWNLIASHPLYTQNEQSVKFLSVNAIFLIPSRGLHYVALFPKKAV